MLDVFSLILMVVSTWNDMIKYNVGDENVPAMFQQDIEKAPKLIEFQRLTLSFLYPEPQLKILKRLKWHLIENPLISLITY